MQARSIVVVTARFAADRYRFANELVEAMKKRFIVGENKNDVPFWQRDHASPSETKELDEAFRALGGRSVKSDEARQDTWEIRGLKPSKATMELLRELKPNLNLKNKSCENLAEARIKKAELRIFPLGYVKLLLHIEWTFVEKGTRSEQLESLCDGLSALRHARSTRLGDNQSIWSRPFWFRDQPEVAKLGDEALPQPRDAESEPEGEKSGAYQRRKVLGPFLPRREMKGVSDDTSEITTVDLASISNWILALSGEESNPPDRVSNSRYAQVATTVVLATPPDDELSVERLNFRLRRGAKSNYVPPRSPGLFDRVLEPRGNRLIGVSREGIASVSWQIDGANDTFEMGQWPPKFLGIYLWLYLLASAERAVLAELSAEIGRDVQKLVHLDSDVATARAEIEKKLARFVAYTGSLVGEDPGGLSEYAEFFVSSRAVFGTRDALQELRTEIHELARLVTTAHESRRATAAEQALNEDRKRLELARDEGLRDAKFQRRVAVAGVFGIGMASLTGLFGLTVQETHEPGIVWLNPDFWPLTAISVGVSLLMAFAVHRRIASPSE